MKWFLNIIRILYIFLFLILLIFIAIKVIYPSKSTIFADDFEPTTLLFAGIGNGDHRGPTEGYRTDVLFLVTIDPSNENDNLDINVVSIPRDTSTYITCGGYIDKINHAYSIGFSGDESHQEAIDCTKSTIENMFDIKIDYYLLTYFEGLIQIVDMLGGIKINADYAFCEMDSNDVRGAICFSVGEQRIDGEGALAYARQRSLSSNYERMDRQLEIMISIILEMIDSREELSISDYRTIFEEVIFTDLEFSTIIRNISNVKSKIYEILTTLSAEKTVSIHIKSSPYSIVNSSDTSNKILNSGPVATKYYYDEIYEDEDELYYHTELYNYSYTLYDTRFPRMKLTEEEINETERVTIEFEHLIPMSEGVIEETGWYSYITDEAMQYVKGILQKPFKSED